MQWFDWADNNDLKWGQIAGGCVEECNVAVNRSVDFESTELAGSVERKSGLNPARNLLNPALVTIAVEFAAVAIDVAVFAAEFAALVAGGGVVAVSQVTA